MAPAAAKQTDQPSARTTTEIKKKSPVRAAKEPRSTATAHQRSRNSTERLSFLWYLLPFVVTTAHVLYAPYTKVEETPALHAVHDVLAYGVTPSALQRYEHVLYPGAVPRSLIPSLMIAGISHPMIWLGKHAHLIKTGLQVQTTVRIVMAAAFSASLAHMATTLSRSSSVAAKAFLLLSLTQFHVPFYSGRFLPNFLALPVVIYAFSLILRRASAQEIEKPSTKISGTSPSLPKSADVRILMLAISLLTFTATVIRLELAPLVVVAALTIYLQSRLSFSQTIIAGALGGFGGLALTAAVDGYFYYPTSHPLSWWPELSAFMFNIPQGKAAEWGVMPWYHYLAVLPRLLMASLPLAVVYPALARSKEERSQIAIIGLPCIAVVAALSCIGHKEWRFVVYVIPLVNVLAAKSVAKLWYIGSQKWSILIRLALSGMLFANVAITILLSIISGKNYPGGQIGPLLEDLTQGQAAKIWVPAAALHSGATAYTLPPTHLIDVERRSNITIVRPESSYEASHSPSGNTPQELWDEGYDWVVTDDWELFTGDHVEEGKTGWEVRGEVEGYQGLGIVRRWPVLEIRSGRKLAVVWRVRV